MPFWAFYYHIVWATHQRKHLITPALEPIIYQAVQDKSNELGCPVHGINSMPDHIHIAVSIRPSLSVSNWVRQIKGYVSHDINHSMTLDEPFHWQKSYGAMTLGQKTLPFVLDYIANQKVHHAKNEVYAYLEKVEDDDENDAD